ncbi:MAG TPA: o-succinylbenzoate synthase [Candidatus Binataceae bacterium]|nr:o-succinylbenzoate synthase [Candidatus Binataceae bacterium]
MKIRRLTWRAYRIPFRRMFVTSGGAEQVREGVILRLESDTGICGLGEIAPLRGGTARNVVHWLTHLPRRIEGIEVDDIPQASRRLEVRKELRAAIACGLDIAACDLLAKEAGVSVVELLGGCRRRLVPVNATIAEDTPALAAQSARRAVESGFRCVKLKVGMMGSLAAECELVGAVRDAIGADTLLRLDANQAWDRDTAIDYIGELERFGLEFVEQPVAAHDLDGLAEVHRTVGTLIAADESVSSRATAQAIVEMGAASLLVIKPMIVGGLRPAMEIIDLALSCELEPVITTTIDSGVGIAAALHLAASFEGKRACGLATAELLECDLTSATPQPHDGWMACPDGAGLGVEIDEVKAAAYLERA